MFLQSCKKSFGMKDGDLFDPYDLVEAKDFNNVSAVLSLVFSAIISTCMYMVPTERKLMPNYH